MYGLGVASAAMLVKECFLARARHRNTPCAHRAIGAVFSLALTVADMPSVGMLTSNNERRSV
jgi:hypothetical protein